MQREQWTEQLRHLAAELRPRDDSARISTLGLASKLGVQVRLIGSKNGSGPVGRLRISSRPIIELPRLASTAFSRNLDSTDEGLLTTRDRFTVAHELGHWLAYARFGVQPPVPRDKSRYWRMEQEINRFAGELLVPDWQAERWLARHDGCGVHIARLLEWSRDCGASPEVVARRISRLRNGIGFLKLSLTNSRPFPVYKAIFSSFAGDLVLPEQHKIIRNERLAIALASTPMGDRRFVGFRFDPKQKSASDLFCSWAKSQPPRAQDDGGARPSGLRPTGYWTSWGRKGFSFRPETEELPV